MECYLCDWMSLVCMLLKEDEGVSYENVISI